METVHADNGGCDIGRHRLSLRWYVCLSHIAHNHFGWAFIWPGAYKMHTFTREWEKNGKKNHRTLHKNPLWTGSFVVWRLSILCYVICLVVPFICLNFFLLLLCVLIFQNIGWYVYHTNGAEQRLNCLTRQVVAYFRFTFLPLCIFFVWVCVAVVSLMIFGSSFVVYVVRLLVLGAVRRRRWWWCECMWIAFGISAIKLLV